MGVDRRSWAIYAAIVASLVACRLALAGAALDFKNPGQRLMLQWPALAALAAYGAAGVALCARAGFPPLWNAGLAQGRGFLLAVAHGVPIGLATIGMDLARPVAAVLGVETAHIPWPEAVPFYWYGAVFSEIWYHLVPVPLVVYLVAFRLRRGAGQEAAFWVALAVLAAWENRRFFDDPALWDATEALRNAVSYTANASEIWLLRRYGFLAALGQRVTIYSLWHVTWPALQG